MSPADRHIPDKTSLRRQIRTARRLAQPTRDRHADAVAIAEAVRGLLPPSRPAAAGAETDAGMPCVAAYLALPTEPPTDVLLQELTALGARVLVPELLPDNDLDWRPVLPDGGLGASLGLEAIGEADVIVTPGLAVDRFGTRLGQGGGSYDRALARRRATALVVAVVNDQEHVGWALPREPHDVRVDAVVTPGGGLVRLGAGSMQAGPMQAGPMQAGATGPEPMQAGPMQADRPGAGPR